MAMPVGKEEGLRVLQDAYRNATKKGGLRDFTEEVRTPNNDLGGKNNLNWKYEPDYRQVYENLRQGGYLQ